VGSGDKQAPEGVGGRGERARMAWSNGGPRRRRGRRLVGGERGTRKGRPWRRGRRERGTEGGMWNSPNWAPLAQTREALGRAWALPGRSGGSEED
jgi:hypothetical protein